jgi:hypothetical protein
MRQSENCELAECVSNRWPKKCFREEREEREGISAKFKEV